MLIDLHTHTYPKSDDSFLTLEELVQEARRVGLDGLCLTEHDAFWDPVALHSFWRQSGFLVLPGCEVTTDEGHFLTFGLNKYVFGMHKLSFLRRLVDEAGGVLVAAHPYRRRYQKAAGQRAERYEQMLDQACQDQCFNHCHGVEVLNGRGAVDENRFAKDLAARLGKGATGGSDSHRLSDVGTYATRFEGNITCLDDLIRELKAGRYGLAVLGRDRAQPPAKANWSPPPGRLPHQ